MSVAWKLAVLAATLVATLVALPPGGSLRPPAAHAEDCTPGETGSLVIRIVNTSTDATLSIDGTSVLITPDPRDWVLDYVVTDIAISDAHSSVDKDPRAGFIQFDNACSTEGSERYIVTIWSLPSRAECTTAKASDTAPLAAGGTAEFQVEVTCEDLAASPTPVPTATGTPGPAAAVTAGASPTSVGCGGTSIVTIQVRDAAGRAVNAGTPVTVSTSRGSLSPGSGHVTGVNGVAVVFFTAPATGSGNATILAVANGVSGSVTVGVNCGATGAGTTAPPPTVGTGVIRPPNTGDGGLRGQQAVLTLGVAVAGLLVLGGTVVIGRARG